ncbi:hypothetical protein ACFFYR_01425, partial [Paraburkholderia dipogonis]
STVWTICENRNVGLDGVVAQQANYRKSGFSAGLPQHSLSGRRARHLAQGEPYADLLQCFGGCPSSR